MFKRFSLYPFFLLIISIAILTFVLISLSKIVFRAHKIDKEIFLLEREIQDLEKNKKEFSQLIEYLQTDSFKEREARLKLDLQKPGEKVVVISMPETDLINKEKQEKKNNLNKWWRYFFGNYRESNKVRGSQ